MLRIIICFISPASLMSHFSFFPYPQKAFVILTAGLAVLSVFSASFKDSFELPFSPSSHSTSTVCFSFTCKVSCRRLTYAFLQTEEKHDKQNKRGKQDSMHKYIFGLLCSKRKYFSLFFTSSSFSSSFLAPRDLLDVLENDWSPSIVENFENAKIAMEMFLKRGNRWCLVITSVYQDVERHKSGANFKFYNVHRTKFIPWGFP